MKKIIRFPELKQVIDTKKSIVLVGGCFDILHIGHITFLTRAKRLGDILLVLLETDSAVKIKKGANRPINSQEDRALVLAALASVDYVLLLPEKMDNNAYDKLVNTIKPAIIATTKGDPNIQHKRRQATAVGAEIIEVIERFNDISTSRLIKLLGEDI